MNLSWNGFDDASALYDVLVENNTLNVLDLRGNRLSDESIQVLAPGLAKNDGLRYLKVGTCLELNFKNMQ